MEFACPPYPLIDFRYANSNLSASKYGNLNTTLKVFTLKIVKVFFSILILYTQHAKKIIEQIKSHSS